MTATQTHHFFARGILRSAIIGGIEVGCAHAWRTAPCAKFIVRYNAADFQSVKGFFFIHGSAARPPAAESAAGFAGAAMGTWRIAYTHTADSPDHSSQAPVPHASRSRAPGIPSRET